MHTTASVRETIPTEALFEQSVLPTYARFPLCLARGEGSRVWDEDGREYLDFGAGIAVCSLGHAHPGLIAAVDRQARTLGHTSNLYYTRPQGELAKRIVELVDIPGRCFFCNSGAEANEALYKLARRFGNLTAPGGRHEVITFRQSFHGRTLASIAATGQEKVRKGFEPLTPGFVQATFNDMASVEAVASGRTAAVLLEPIQGESGIMPATADFLRGLRRLCDHRGWLLMFDEVQCGFGRTGDWCAWRSLGAPEVEPDAISWAKGMAGGFPMGAIWARDRAVTMADGTASRLGDLFGPGSHGTTFGGNPLGCAAALATFGTIQDEGLLANVADVGAYAKKLLRQIALPIIGEVRGVGLMIGLELDAEAVKATALSQGERAPSLQLVDRLQAAGLLAVPAGTHVMRWLPALNVTKIEVERAVAILTQVLTGVSRRAGAKLRESSAPVFFPAMKNLLSIESLTRQEILEIVAEGAVMKATRGRHAEHPLRHRCWGMIFSKSSTRTRVSFEVGIRELGGDALFFNGNDLQMGSRGEPVEDTARVLGRMLHGAVIRTYAQEDVETFARASGLPTVNALTDAEHPCQILSDLLTIQEGLGSWSGKTICYLGDGACNVPVSWMWAAARLGDFRLVVAAPKTYQPVAALLARLGAGDRVVCEEDPCVAAAGADVLYTDVWVSMGMEAEAAERSRELGGYGIDAALVKLAKPGALIMHCLPAYRGKEITAEVMEAHADTIFTQAENRLHVQKAILSLLAKSHKG